MADINYGALPEEKVLRFVRWVHESVVTLKQTPEGRAKLAEMHEARMRREAEKRAKEAAS